MRLENWAKILYVDPRDESVGCSVFLKFGASKCLYLLMFSKI